MSRRKANLEYEYQLEREIKDLKQEISKLKNKLRELEKHDKTEKVTKPEPKKAVTKECPKCGAKIKESNLPMGTLELCEAACGYRGVKKK